MKLNSSQSWKLDYMKLASILGKLGRGLMTSGVLIGVVEVLSSTLLPELKAISPTISAVAGIILMQIIEALNKISKDYSK